MDRGVPGILRKINRDAILVLCQVSESFPEYALPLNALLAGVDQVMCNIYGSHYVPEGNPVVIYCAEESATA